jgi:hypothetical protein
MFKVGDPIINRGRRGVVTGVATSFSSYYHLETGTCGECLNTRLEHDMAPRKKAEPKADKGAKDLLDMALAFCRPGFKEDGEPYAKHAFISNNWITTYNGIVMYGHPIADALQCLPHFGRLDTAIRTAGAGLALTQASPERLQVKGSTFKASVPCLSDPALVVRQNPDNPIVAIDNLLRKAFENVRNVPVGDRVVQQSVLLDSSIITGTDAIIIVQYAHGVHLPQLVIPVEFAKAVLATTKNIISIGWSERSFTVWFEAPEGMPSGNPFMRTQLYTEAWPDIGPVVNVDYNQCKPLPDRFFEALDQLVPFSDEGTIYFGDGVMKTSPIDDDGAEVAIKGLLPCKLAFDGSRLLKIKGRFTHIDYQSDPMSMRFTGPNFRGVLMGIGEKQKEAPRSNEAPLPGGQSGTEIYNLDDDIPF